VPVQHGNSGGALVDFATGWVIGVINAKLESRAGISADNVSYAIKGRVVRTFLDSVSAAKAAVDANPPKALDHGDERAVIDRATQSAVLILRRR
jgi:S1-C subfamily serine protease